MHTFSILLGKYFTGLTLLLQYPCQFRKIVKSSIFRRKHLFYYFSTIKQIKLDFFNFYYQNCLEDFKDAKKNSNTRKIGLGEMICIARNFEVIY